MSDFIASSNNNLFGKTIVELVQIMESFDEKSYRANQLFKWLYDKRINAIDQASNIPEDLINQLSKNKYEIWYPEIVKSLKSSDGSEKFVFVNRDDQKYEAVWLPFEDRNSICISCQSGCTLNCHFCATAKIPMNGNLTVSDILGQVLQIEKATGNKADNIVFMGMGEVFYNYNTVISACGILSSENGFKISERKITLSTAGIIPGIKRFIKNRHKYNLAVSLNHSNNEGRSLLMPVNRKYPMEELRKTAILFNKEMSSAITFEYVMISEINMTQTDADNIINFLKGLNAKLNLIPYNGKHHTFKSPGEENIKKFITRLEPLKKYKIPVINRGSPAKDINAACGMLALK